ncbi:sodium:solute symporter, partial [bacterium]
ATQIANLAVVLAYLAAIVGVGVWFALKKKSAEQFMVANQSLPGWAVGLSMFGSYISAISFLGNPGVAFKGNWMYAAFTVVTPIGLLFGTLVFMRFYRRTRAISAYSHLEHRFGPWARTYAVFTFLVLQMARQGTILYLLGQATTQLLGGDPSDLWTTRAIIVGVGLLITFYTLFGGIEAVVWTGVLQSVVLLLGPVVCIVALLVKTPGGLGHVVSAGMADGKFGFGPFDTSFVAPTFWIVVLSAILEHLRNWGVDQSYIQRYLATPSEKDAARSIWIAGLLYIPVGMFFFFIGTALYVYYQSAPQNLPAGLPVDQIFPRFISYELPMGLGGLVIAAVFAASMDSNLNSMATLTLVDGYKRYVRPHAGERESMRVLYASTVFWGVMSIAWALVITLKSGNQIMAEFAIK